ncbi:MAG TPA: hypothetical protein DCZ92_07900 [Elusimicrobia bacterium]|nr:MAG: hypothetical protein A2016_02170 [Elusimicrobia bacterium GWF2_62_30]HBA60727.1 hypothetical protein [Elusimicrobiota bacterium]
MYFFRLRVINTILFLVVGVFIGFILKGRVNPPPVASAAPRYQPAYEAVPVKPEAEAVEAEEEELPPEPEKAAGPRRAAAPAPAREEEDAELSIEADTPAPPGARRQPVFLSVEPAAFFKGAAGYAGRDLEMTLQLITVKKAAGGWRLNFVYTFPDKTIDYLYLDDTSTLGTSPDLRIGYVYNVRFRCERGDLSDGNTLSFIEPTGDKANWATGLSAIE